MTEYELMDLSANFAATGISAVMGFFTVSGAVGIVIATMVGGFLFDIWRSAGPFLFFSMVNGILMVCAFVLRNKVHPPAENLEEAGV